MIICIVTNRHCSRVIGNFTFYTFPSRSHGTRSSQFSFLPSSPTIFFIRLLHLIQQNPGTQRALYLGGGELMESTAQIIREHSSTLELTPSCNLLAGWTEVQFSRANVLMVLTPDDIYAHNAIGRHSLLVALSSSFARLGPDPNPKVSIFITITPLNRQHHKSRLRPYHSDCKEAIWGGVET